MTEIQIEVPSSTLDVQVAQDYKVAQFFAKDGLAQKFITRAVDGTYGSYNETAEAWNEYAPKSVELPKEIKKFRVTGRVKAEAWFDFDLEVEAEDEDEVDSDTLADLIWSEHSTDDFEVEEYDCEIEIDDIEERT